MTTKQPQPAPSGPKPEPSPAPPPRAPANHTVRVPTRDRKRILKLLKNWLTAQANDGCREVVMDLAPSGNQVVIVAIAPLRLPGRRLVRVVPGGPGMTVKPKPKPEPKPAPGASISSSSSDATATRPSAPARPGDGDYAEPPGQS